MTYAQSYTLFETPIGTCGIAWGPLGITAIALPEASADLTAARLVPKGAHAVPPREVQRAIADVRALLDGEPRDLAQARLDMTGVPEFHRAVYAAARRIAPGNTSTYGDLAREVGAPRAARAVGGALARNPFILAVPCHRVLSAGGKLGGFSAHGGLATKIRLLEIEGAVVPLGRGKAAA